VAKVLIVEDSPVTRARMRTSLSKQGYEIKEAANGREALTMLEVFTPDCILLDLMMPEMGGLDFLRRQNERGAHPPVVVLHTGFPESTLAACRAEGAIDFLLKPFDPDELTSAVREAVALNAASGAGIDRDEVASRPVSFAPHSPRGASRR
jgi:CheY-like chemotaxis protein